MRYLILNGAVIAVHESKYGASVSQSRDLERVSFDKTEWNKEIVEQSIKIAELLGLEFACVDYLIDKDGQHFILEVGAAPGFKWFHAPTSGPAVDVARMFLDSYIAKSTLTLSEGATV
jgi:D-alanine-D-alanine ligase-like ATP-grasp enzyme